MSQPACEGYFKPMPTFTTVYKRCRPLLGTFVEVSLFDVLSSQAEACIEAAYRAIEQVGEVMSFHLPESDLSRLNRTPVGRWISVSAHLAEVLTLAIDLHHQSDGMFNVAVARPLIVWGLLPGVTSDPGWRHLAGTGFEVSGRRARRLSPIQIDLGGIAKGYAVDRAVAAIRALHERPSGCVNAGGDLRVFGREQPVLIRSGDPERPCFHWMHKQNCAVATSTSWPKAEVSPYVDAKNRGPLLAKRTVTVSARDCVVADALTKIALLLPCHHAQRVARAYQSEMILL